jgi:histidinol-phosphate/aromatic aminotransferase/cobyric acid decarboxylase-like protein
LEITEAVDKYNAEFKDKLKEMQDFWKSNDIEDILRTLSRFTSRAAHVRYVLTDYPNNPRATRFRIDKIDPFITEADRQFKIYSRIQSITETEMKLS